MLGIIYLLNNTSFKTSLIKCQLIALIFLCLFPFCANAQNQELQQLQVIQTLNYITVSLSRIINYNDQGVLQQEYDNVLNNINLNQIPDQDLITMFKKLMYQITEEKISNKQYEFIKERYLKNVNNALVDGFKNFASSINFNTPNPYVIAASALANVGPVYFDYTAKIDKYKSARKEEEWNLQKDLIKRLNDLRSEILNYSWVLLRSYVIPDEWRLSEENVDSFIKALRDHDTDLDKKIDIKVASSRLLRRLKIQEDRLSMYPPYWYYRGKAAQDSNQNEEAIKSYERFAEIRLPIWRKDPFVPAVAMKTIELQPDSEHHVFKNLELIKRNSRESDWSNYLFMALQYARFDNNKLATDMISISLDNGNKEILSSPAVLNMAAETVLVSPNKQVVDRAIQAIVDGSDIKAYDIVRTYGEMKNKDILKALEPDLSKIRLIAYKNSSVNPKKVLNKDSLILLLPKKFYLENMSIFLQLNPNSVDTNHLKTNLFWEYRVDKELFVSGSPIVALIFEDMISISDIIKSSQKHIIEVNLFPERLPHDRDQKQSYRVIVSFNSELRTLKEELTFLKEYNEDEIEKYAVGKLHGNLLKYFTKADDQTQFIGFRLNNISFNGDVFEIDGQSHKLLLN
jgi:hypothetical protein